MENQKQLFWDAIDKVNEEDLNQDNELTLQKATELSVWLHTEFQCKMEEASSLMDKEAADEKKPFEEKYMAREILQNLRKNEYLSDKYTKIKDAQDVNVDEAGSDVMRCGLGIVLHKLGINFYDSEETKDALVYLMKSFKYMESLPDQLKVRHLNTIQDLYNHIAIIMSDRGGATEKEDVKANDEAIQYLNKARDIYTIVSDQTQDMPQKSIMNNFDLYLLK